MLSVLLLPLFFHLVACICICSGFVMHLYKLLNLHEFSDFHLYLYTFAGFHSCLYRCQVFQYLPTDISEFLSVQLCLYASGFSYRCKCFQIFECISTIMCIDVCAQKFYVIQYVGNILWRMLPDTGASEIASRFPLLLNSTL